MRLLVTGSAGSIGRVITQGLRARGHFVRGFDRAAHGGCDEALAGDIADAVAVDQAAAGCEAVIHLAAEPNDAPFVTTLLQPNVVGTFRVMDACRRLGVKRVVLASTMQVVSGHKGLNRPVRIEDGPAPTNHYALTKSWAEAMGEMYARRYGLEVIAGRIGWFLRTPDETDHMIRLEALGGYLSHDDAVRFFTAAVESPVTRPFQIFFVLSDNDGRAGADLAPGRTAIGYEPRDAFPRGTPTTITREQSEVRDDAR